MLVKVLIDNISNNELLCEWGLSVYVEYKDKKILLDGGTTGAFAKNAKMLGIDLSAVDFGVISHAHYDHADGIAAFFGANDHAPVYLREGSEENCFKQEGPGYKYIGIREGFLEEYADRLRYVEGDFSPSEGVYLIPHKTEGLEKVGEKAHMYREWEGVFSPDTFAHEQSLVFDTSQGLVIFNSCSHGGADNIIREIGDTFPDKKIYALFGGLHLHASADEDVLALAERIRQTGIRKIYTGHCTGDHALELLKQELGDVVEGIYSGFTISDIAE